MSRHPSIPALVSTIIDVRDDLFPEIISGNSQLKRVGGAVVRVWRGDRPAGGARPRPFLPTPGGLLPLHVPPPPPVVPLPRHAPTFFTLPPTLPKTPHILASAA